MFCNICTTLSDVYSFSTALIQFFESVSIKKLFFWHTFSTFYGFNAFVEFAQENLIQFLTFYLLYIAEANPRSVLGQSIKIYI